MTPKKTSNNTTKEFYQYDNISLQTYYEIAHTGDVGKVQKNGSIDLAMCENVWDEILQRNAKENGSLRYEKIFRNTRQYWMIASEYVQVKTALTILALRQNDEIIKDLHKKGYHIRKDSIEQYALSLEAAHRKSDNLRTKVASKQKELELWTADNGGETIKQNVNQLLVEINCELGFIVPPTILLCEFNEYKKQIRNRQQAEKEQLRRLKTRQR